jgi:hypothetical protein
MARRQKQAVREQGLYLNGKRWWVRSVRSPLTGVVRPLSTGTDDLSRANTVARAVRGLTENRNLWPWLDLAVKGEVSLDTLTTHFSASTLHQLRAERDAVTATQDASAADPDIEPWVKRWDEEHQSVRVATGAITQERRELALRYVRAFIPEGVPFRRSQFSEEEIKRRMAALRNPKNGLPLAGATLRKYVDALQLFYKFVRKPHRAAITVNPFDDADWVPANSDPRAVAWELTQAEATLDHIDDAEAKAFCALALGAGVELGGILALKGRDVGPGGGESGRWVTVHATTKGKNTSREQRKVFVRKWAWDRFIGYARSIAPTASLWVKIKPVNRGRDVRDVFYKAQMAAGLIDAPPVNKATGKRLWKSVNPHHIHDARHTYINITALGLDGERRLSPKEQSHNLGHADETMVIKIYGKLGLEQRVRLIELAEERAAGKREQAAEAAGDN